MKRPAITIVGAGRLGSALAKHLRAVGYLISEIVYRDRGPLSKARALARIVHARPATLETARLDAKLVWFCVPDSQIEAAATKLATRSWKGKIAVHSSGVLTSDALASLRKAGACAISAHPLMTFIRGSVPDLGGVPFAMEGDRTAVRSVRAIVRDLGGKPMRIRKQDKPAYHLFATMICPLLISLLAASEESAQLVHISRSEARSRMLPILRQTISNYETVGAAAAFTGPFARGDVETVRMHLKALSKNPELRNVYVALASSALKHLPHRQANKLRSTIREAAQ